jgi:hypothetical protein
VILQRCLIQIFHFSGYGTPNLITSYGKILCIIYTIIGLIFALVFQQIVHRLLIPILYDIIAQLALNRSLIYHTTKYRSFLVSFLIITFLIAFIFLIIPTLIIHTVYVPEWSFIELTYFAVTTNHLIGFGDFMPCGNLFGQSRSSCAMIMTSKHRIFLYLFLYFSFFSLCNHSSPYCEYS